MNIEEIKQLINLIDNSTIDEFVYKASGAEIILKKHCQGPKETNLTSHQKPTLNKDSQVVDPPSSSQSEEREVGREAETEGDGNLLEIVSPMVGTFYESQSPEAEPYVRVGSKVGEKQVVCIVEAMKLFNEIEAEVKGEIVEILVSNGQLVEFGQPLFLVKPE